jgi:hypothetical protein
VLDLEYLIDDERGGTSCSRFVVCATADELICSSSMINNDRSKSTERTELGQLEKVGSTMVQSN